MTERPVFELVEMRRLHEHEEIEPAGVQSLADQILAEGVVKDPIWVARGSWVILNGHHRVAALKRLGARRVPAWVFDYDSATIRLERWSPGPTISKAEVVERAKRGDPFTPKTTRHVLHIELPARPTPIADLGLSGAPAKAVAHRRASARSRSSGARAPETG